MDSVEYKTNNEILKNINTALEDIKIRLMDNFSPEDFSSASHTVLEGLYETATEVMDVVDTLKEALNDNEEE